MQVILIINKLDVRDTKAKFRGMNSFLVSFVSKNMTDTQHSAHKMFQADFNNSHYVKK